MLYFDRLPSILISLVNNKQMCVRVSLFIANKKAAVDFWISEAWIPYKYRASTPQ